MIKIEFFHDVICSFCFPMSARMRKIQKQYNNIEIIHRSFALGWSEQDFIYSFGSREAVKPEVINHWIHANQNDDEHRFNIDGMRQTTFNFPISKPGLIACKAAGRLDDEKLYWDVFDRIQNKLFVENKNIEEDEVIFEAIKETSIDFDKWLEFYHDDKTEQAVLEDFNIGQHYGVRSAPTLIINGKYAISGAQPQNDIERALEKIAQHENDTLNTIIDFNPQDSDSCKIINGKWECE